MFSFWCTRFGKLGSLNKLFGFCLEGKFQGTIKPLKALQITILPKRRWCYLCYLKHKNSTIVASSWKYRKAIVRPPPPPFCWGGRRWGGLNLQPNFQIGGRGLGRTSTFGGRLLGKRGWLFQEGCNFHKKNHFKYLMTKKVYRQKSFSVITKNSN